MPFQFALFHETTLPRVTRPPKAAPAGQPAPSLKRAQKRAAERAVAKVRERQAALAKGVEDASPLEDAVLVRLYVNDSKIGCGFRPFVVCGIGAKWVTLFQPATLATLKVDRITFDRRATALSPEQAPKKTVRKIIRRRMAEAERLSFRFSRETAKRALALVSSRRP